jgi:hypothetical protein
MSYIKRERAIKTEIRKHFGIPDINKIAEDINAQCGDIVSWPAVISTKKKHKSWHLNLQKIVWYEKCQTSSVIFLRSSEEVTSFIKTLNSTCEILRCPEVPKSIKAMINDFYRRRMKVMAEFWPDLPYTKELFARRSEIPKDSPFMSDFIEDMLQIS